MYLPCLNPSCKSHGKPHPNCKCYGPEGNEMSKGGEAIHFCSENRMHNKECQYYQDGGEVLQFDDLKDDNDQQQSATQEPAPLNFDDLKEDTPSEQPVQKFDDLKDDSENYGTTNQQIKAGLEGAAQGILGPFAPILEEKYLGVKPEDIAGRQQENPITHGVSEAAALAGSLMTGVGEAAGIAKIAEAVPEISALGKAGSAALRGFLQGTSMVGSDEITKGILGQGDPEHPVSAALLHMGANGLLGSATGGIFNVLGKTTDFAQQKMADGAEKLLLKIAHEGKPINEIMSMGAGAKVGTVFGKTIGYETYEAFKKNVAPKIEEAFGRPISKANKYISDAIMKLLSTNNSQGMAGAARFGSYVSNGIKTIQPWLEAIFRGGTAEAIPHVTDDLRKQLEDYIKEGGTDQQLQNEIQNTTAPQKFAIGGEVIASPPNETDNFGTSFPEHNILFNTAKSRISNYLNNIRPLGNESKLPFDDEQPNIERKRSYENALNLAISPISILKKVHDTTLVPEDMKHFSAMYPEVHRFLSQEMTKKIMESQLAGEKPSYLKRQALSMFMGTALDSTLTPSAMQAIQNVFMGQKTSQQSGQQQMRPPKKAKQSLSKAADSYRTDDQARQARLQKT